MTRMQTTDTLPRESLVGLILRGEAYRDTYDRSQIARMHERMKPLVSSDDSTTSCVPTLDTQRVQMCSTTAIIEKVIRPLTQDLGNTIHLAATECSRRAGCPLFERRMLPMLRSERGVQLIGNLTRCRSRTQSEGVRLALQTFIDGAAARRVRLSDYRLVLMLRHDDMKRDSAITEWTGDFRKFNFAARRCPWQSARDKNNVRKANFVSDNMQLIPGRYLRRWVQAALGRDGCFGQGIDPKVGMPHGHYCKEATRAVLGGADRVGEVTTMACPFTQTALDADRNVLIKSDTWPARSLCFPYHVYGSMVKWSSEEVVAALRHPPSGPSAKALAKLVQKLAASADADQVRPEAEWVRR